MKKVMLVNTIMLSSAFIFAQDGNILPTLDTDGDGRISIQEVSSDNRLARVFVDLDIDRDGYLTTAELTVSQ